MLKNTFQSYGTVAKLFHWVVAILMILMFIIAYTMTNLPKTNELRLPLFDVHKATGVLIFGLVALRLIWRALNVRPVLVLPAWQLYLAKANIFLLYALMFLMPLSGFLTSTLGGHDVSFYGLFVIPAFTPDKPTAHFFSESHEFLSYILIASFVLHVAGSLYHQYVLKDNVLKRMWFS